MHEWEIILVLGIALLSTVAIGIVCAFCRQAEREKNRSILQALREQDRLARELEHVRIEKEAIERIIGSMLNEGIDSDAKNQENNQF